MSLELVDLRARITPESHCAISARAQHEGVEMSEIVRDVLHQWALREIDRASLLQRRLRAQGLVVDSKGTP